MTTKQQAKRIDEYLRSHGYNTPREVAADLGLDEAEYSLAVRELTHYRQGVRRDSYGREVAWLTVLCGDNEQ